ncbi:MAG: hypothetical protein EOM59_06475 [Clostridia bacterium]|nr:hypothetical protein [Clostridia bacterium]
MSRKEKDQAKQRLSKKRKSSTKDLIGIDRITDYSVMTGHGELVYFIIEPANLSVLSEVSILQRINGLKTILKGIAEIEMLALNSKESFESNKRFLRDRIEIEEVPAVRKLLEKDHIGLDQLQVQMATAREFLMIIRLKGEKESEILPYLSRIEKSLSEQGFTAGRAGTSDLKRVLGVYFEQNVTSDMDDSDGERWVILND